MSPKIMEGSYLKDRYLVKERLGVGGMGAVWRCFDSHTRKHVALKHIHPSDSSRQWQRLAQLFWEEASALASLSNPHLVRALDFGHLEGDGAPLPFLIMEYIQGRSLQEFSQLPWQLLAAICDQLLEGLGHIHARGILHRDLKPSNIMLGIGDHDELHVTLVDFGIARMGTLLEDFAPPIEEGQVRAAPNTMCTPRYAAPEQLQATAFFQGPATDFYALGVMLHQYCCGELPFQGTTEELTRQVFTAAPPDFAPCNGAPQGVGELVAVLLRKEPWRRLQFAAHIRGRLREFWEPQAAQQQWQRFRQEHPDSWEAAPPTQGSVGAIEASAPTVDVSRLRQGLVAGAEGEDLASPSLLQLQIPPLVGRHAERERLLPLLRNTQAGNAIAVLRGDAGVGKSRLAQTLMEQAHQEGWRLGLRADLQVDHSLVGALERHFSLQGAKSANIFGKLRKLWAQQPNKDRLSAVVAELMRPTPRGRRRDDRIERHLRVVSLDRREARVQYIHRAFGLLKEPLLLWIDDLQQADEELLEQLRALLRDPSLSLCVLATWGDDQACWDEGGKAMLLSLLDPGQAAALEQAAAPPDLDALLQATLAHADRPFVAEVLALEPLSEDQVRQLMQHQLPALASEAIDAVAAQPQSRNPQYLLQLLHSWRGKLRWREQRYQIPPEILQQLARSTQDLLDQRLETLTPQLRAAAQVALTLGLRFPRLLLEDLLERHGLPQAHLMQLLDKQILRPVGRDLAWSHPHLLRRLEEQNANSPESAALYQETADYLQSLPQGELSSQQVAPLLVHALLRAGQTSAACAQLFAQLEQAWNARQNAQELEKGLALLLGQKLAPLEAARLLRWKAEAALLKARLKEANELAHRAVEGFGRAGDLQGLADAQRILGDSAAGMAQYAEALDWLTRAILTCGHSPTAARIHLLLSQTHHFAGHVPQSRHHAEMAQKLAYEHSLRSAYIDSSLRLAVCDHDLGQHTQAISRAQTALQRCVGGGESLNEGQAQVLLAWLHLAQKQDDQARSYCEQAQERFHAMGHWWWENTARLVLGWICCWEGKLEQAQAHAAHSRQRFASEGERFFHEVGQSWLLSAGVHLVGGDAEAAHRALLEAIALERSEPMLQQPLQLLRAWAFQLQGNGREAEAALQFALGIWQAFNLSTWGVARLVDALLPFEWSPQPKAMLRQWDQKLTIHAP